MIEQGIGFYKCIGDSTGIWMADWQGHRIFSFSGGNKSIGVLHCRPKMCEENDPQLCDSLGKENEISTFSGQLNSWDVLTEKGLWLTRKSTPHYLARAPCLDLETTFQSPEWRNWDLEITIWFKIVCLANISSDLRLYMSFRVSNQTHNLLINHEPICCWEGMNSVRPWLTFID